MKELASAPSVNNILAVRSKGKLISGDGDNKNREQQNKQAAPPAQIVPHGREAVRANKLRPEVEHTGGYLDIPSKEYQRIEADNNPEGAVSLNLHPFNSKQRHLGYWVRLSDRLIVHWHC